jgi:hypothetical protein
MDNRNNLTDLQQTLMDSYKRMADMSMNTMKPFMEGMAENVSTMNRTMSESGLPNLMTAIPGMSAKESTCCPPEPKCPPHCISTITRHALEGERIVESFLVRNSCSTEKTYRIGVRELKDQDGQMAPSQPVMNKSSVTLAPGARERVVMMVDLKSANSGSVYTTEIVLREKEINQNICFKLIVEGHSNLHQVTPHDEKKYRLKWQDWRTHFYCEPPKKREANIRETPSSN